MYRLFGSPIPLRRFDALGAFQASASRTLFGGWFGLSRTSSPVQRPRWVLPATPAANREASMAPPMRFLPLQRLSAGESADRPVPPGHLPPSTFFRSLRAYSSPVLAALFQAADAPGVSRPSEPFSCRRTLLGLSSSDPLSAFFRLSEEIRPRPQGFRYAGNPYRSSEYCILRQTVALLGFHLAFTALRRLGRNPFRGSSAPGLCFGPVHAHFRSGATAF